jgi:predicted lactoylglutathione lyase
MGASMIWANLPVDDINATEKFYLSLGVKPNGRSDSDELVSFLFGGNGFIIHFFQREKLETSMNDKTIREGNGSEVIFSISADTEQEVVDWTDKVKAAGGKIFREAKRQDDGYFYCVFSDLDGHKFNVLLLEKGM